MTAQTITSNGVKQHIVFLEIKDKQKEKEKEDKKKEEFIFMNARIVEEQRVNAKIQREIEELMGKKKSGAAIPKTGSQVTLKFDKEGGGGGELIIVIC